MMRAFQSLMSDRRRAQRGSVLSGVLIMVAFLAILAGALTTALSTNFLLAARLVDHVNAEATVESTVELAIGQLQATSPYLGCPGPAPTSLNSLTAVGTFATCYPVIDAASPQRLSSLAAAGQFLQDGTHAAPAGTGVDQYLTGDADGNLLAYNTGSTTAAWTFAFGGEIVGPPLGMADPTQAPDGISYLVPVTNPTNNASSCSGSKCVGLLSGDGGSAPSLVCYMPASSTVASEPAAGLGYPDVAYFGDSAGNLYAYSATSGGQCDPEASTQVPGADAVVAGPFVLNGTSGGKATDEVYVVVKSGPNGALVHYSYTAPRRRQPSFSFVDSVPLPGVATGAALDGASSRLAISFSNGQVAVVQIQSDFSIGATTHVSLGGPIADGPFWSGGQLGVASGSTMYVLNAGLGVVASYTAGSPIVTTPSADAGGDWFFATSSGALDEAQQSGSSLQVRAVYTDSAFGGGAITSAPLALKCPTGICVYMGSSDNNVYFAGLDARDAVLDSCLSACTTGNFSLRAQVEVAAASPHTVHVQSWTYYSP